MDIWKMRSHLQNNVNNDNDNNDNNNNNDDISNDDEIDESNENSRELDTEPPSNTLGAFSRKVNDQKLDFVDRFQAFALPGPAKDWPHLN